MGASVDDGAALTGSICSGLEPTAPFGGEPGWLAADGTQSS